MVKTLGKVWLAYKKLLVPQGLPMQNFVEIFGRVGSDFSNWGQAGICRLMDLLSRGQLLDIENFQRKILGFNVLQYYQVRYLVLQLQKNKLENTAHQI